MGKRKSGHLGVEASRDTVRAGCGAVGAVGCWWGVKGLADRGLGIALNVRRMDNHYCHPFFHLFLPSRFQSVRLMASSSSCERFSRWRRSAMIRGCAKIRTRFT